MVHVVRVAGGPSLRQDNGLRQWRNLDKKFRDAKL